MTGFEPAASCSQSRRATNCATPGYFVILSGWSYSPKSSAIPTSLHPDIHFSAIISRRGRKSKIFLSVVIYVVKAVFVPLSAIRGNPTNAGVTRLSGVSPCPVPDTATALPNVARYQLRHTRIGEGVRRPITDGVPLLYQVFSGLARGKSAVQSGLQSRHTVGSLPAHAQILTAHVAIGRQLAVDGSAQIQNPG